eukprot:TRINITY_DN8998_c0_g1_i1.p1 TRINITY_DN8998_c0_g1~~TRINITY_DN8998_c0_g1_i1.p1  ORF type:complete len:222 (-),score=32.04 TRINITY_DN8998_c0_g1_i1:88-693(-)
MSWGTKIIPRGLDAKQVMSWSARINKEEKVMVKAYEEDVKQKKRERTKLRSSLERSSSHHSHEHKSGADEPRHRRHHHKHRHPDDDGQRCGSAPSSLPSMGRSASSSAVLSRRSASSSAVLSRTSSGASSSSRFSSMPPLPEDLQPLGGFNLTQDNLMKLRTSEDSLGRMPKLRFRAVKNEAVWVPGCASYVDYKPEFYFG